MSIVCTKLQENKVGWEVRKQVIFTGDFNADWSNSSTITATHTMADHSNRRRNARTRNVFTKDCREALLLSDKSEIAYVRLWR